MTNLELAIKYGSQSYQVKYGETITTVVRNLYGDYSDKYFKSILELNSRFDWDNLDTSVKLQYLDKTIIDSYGN